MARDELTQVLEQWCEAVAAMEAAPHGSAELAAAERRVRQLDSEVRLVVLRLTGRRDQLEGAIQATAERIRASLTTLDDARQGTGEPLPGDGSV